MLLKPCLSGDGTPPSHKRSMMHTSPVQAPDTLQSRDPLDLAPRRVELEDHPGVFATDDAYSQRLKCEHPQGVEDGAAFGRALLSAAERLTRDRVIALIPEALRVDMAREGFRCEAVMPGFYQGEAPCMIMGHSLDGERDGLGFAQEVEVADKIWHRTRSTKSRHPRRATTRATEADAQDLAQLLGQTFKHYPTPSHDPDYVLAQINEGTPFRFVRGQDGQIIACASADLNRAARTAELTDCATSPKARGRGLMQSLLLDLMDDLRRMGYPTAFTMARAREPGINVAFKRLGFSWRGRMWQSCRIGEGLEDMNIWSRYL